MMLSVGEKKNKPIHLTIKKIQVDLKTLSDFSFIEDFHVLYKVFFFS